MESTFSIEKYSILEPQLENSDDSRIIDIVGCGILIKGSDIKFV